MRVPGRAALAAAAGGGAAAPLSGAALILDMRTGVTTVSGDVSAWADQSGNGYDASQSVAGARPPYIASHAALNNQPVLDLTALSDWLDAALLPDDGSDFTAYAVVDLASTASGLVYDQRKPAPGLRRRAFWPSFGGNVGYSNNSATATYGTSVTGPQLLIWTANGTTGRAYRGATELASSPQTVTSNEWSDAAGASAAIGSRYDGGGNYLDGYLAELRFYAAEHDAGQRATMKSYYNSIWGV